MLFKRKRVWRLYTKYTLGSVVYYPDLTSPKFICIHAHRSREGWEPPNSRVLWKQLDE